MLIKILAFFILKLMVLRGQIRLSVASVLKVLEGKMSEKNSKNRLRPKAIQSLFSTAKWALFKPYMLLKLS